MSPRKAERPQRAALTRMLRATGLANVPEEAPLVELLRTLADEIDAGGGSRVRIEYRNAIKDARAVLGATGRVRGTAEPSALKKPEAAAALEAAEEVAPRPNELAEFKQRHGIAS